MLFLKILILICIQFGLNLDLDLLMIVSSRFSIEFWWYIFWHMFDMLWNMVLEKFCEFCFENHDYNDNDLAASSMWLRLGRITC